MANTDPRVDAYIAKSAEFARPILQHLRQLVHKACPGGNRNGQMGHAFLRIQWRSALQYGQLQTALFLWVLECVAC